VTCGHFCSRLPAAFIKNVPLQPKPESLYMNKLMSMLIAATFATASVGAFAAAHGGAMSDADKAKKMEACKKMDAKTADDKMKAECKKLMDGEKKPDAPKK
jgi:hypothetical protein